MTRKRLAGTGGAHCSSRAVVADRGFGAVASRRTLRWASRGGTSPGIGRWSLAKMRTFERDLADTDDGGGSGENEGQAEEEVQNRTAGNHRGIGPVSGADHERQADQENRADAEPGTANGVPRYWDP